MRTGRLIGAWFMVCSIAMMRALPSSAAATPCDWTVDTHGKHLPGLLMGVAAASSTDAWAVGAQKDREANTVHPFVQRWDGTRWRAVPLNDGHPLGGYLDGVAIIPGSNEAWAVGYAYVGPHRYQALIDRWDGASWTAVPAPQHGAGAGFRHSRDTTVLTGVAAISSSDVWAVGTWNSNPPDRGGPLLEHWDGTRWTIVDGPTVDHASLRAVAALAPDDVWAVGATSRSASFIEHWDGHSWSVIPSPSPGSSDSGLSGVAGSAGGDVWAVGDVDFTASLIERWNGTSWSVVPSPSPHRQNWLEAVAVDPGGGAWAVGEGIDGIRSTLAERWDGTSWKVPSTPNPEEENALSDVSVAPDTLQAFAVGSMTHPERGLIERSCSS